MITITLDNIHGTISDLPESIAELLYEKLSYEDDGTTYLRLKNPKLMGLDLRKRLFQRKRHKFPVGLLSLVISVLEDQKYSNADSTEKNEKIIQVGKGSSHQYKIVDARVIPDKYNYFSLKVKFPDLFPHQREALEEIKKRSMNAFSMGTGTGKTLVAMSAVKEWGVNVLVIVPTLNLLNQIKDEFSYHYGKQFVGTHKDEKLKEITIANVQGLQNKGKEFFDHFHGVILDESHHCSAVSYYDLNKKYWSHITYRLFLSATQFRNAGDSMKLYGLIGDVTYTYTSRQAILAGYIVRPHFYIYPITHFSDTGEWHSTYQQNIVENKTRNNKIVGMANKLINETKKTILILVNRIEHATELCKVIPQSLMVTGENPAKENKRLLQEYRLGNIRCVIGTSQVFSEGLDIPNIDVLILGGGFSSHILILQSIGRAVRNSPGKTKCTIVDFMDEGSRILTRHSKERIKIYKMYYFAHDIKFMK